MPTLYADTLVPFVSRIFQAAETPSHAADLVAQSLVESNLAGHDSHGVVRVIQYLAAIENNTLNPKAEPLVTSETPVIAMVDAQRGFGQPAARYAIDLAIDKARHSGMATSGLLNCGHVGRLGEWVEVAANAGLIALAFCNGGGGRGIVAPFGGRDRILGTNPIAAAIPLADRPPVVLDFATSAVAEGKVRIARNSGKSIPEGWILDKHGNPSTQPADLYDGGVILPAAGHKGFGFSLLVEFMGGLLTSAGCPATGMQPGNGVLFLVLNVDAFRPLVDFTAAGEALVDKIKAVAPASGFSEVMLPGEPEHRTAAERHANGIYLDDTTWGELVEAGAVRGVPAPVLLEKK
jgi:LDH2 family malate/lactate/ureidoglycolate dehydrogenase